MNNKVVSLTDKINEQTLANEKKLNYDFLTSIQEVMFDHILNNRCIEEFDQETLEEINARISTLCLIAMNITKNYTTNTETDLQTVISDIVDNLFSIVMNGEMDDS